jgi:hypothetical protein
MASYDLEVLDHSGVQNGIGSTLRRFFNMKLIKLAVLSMAFSGFTAFAQGDATAPSAPAEQPAATEGAMGGETQTADATPAKCKKFEKKPKLLKKCVDREAKKAAKKG